MSHVALSVLHGMTAVQLEPAPIEVLGRDAELDDEVAREVLRFVFPPFLLPEPYERGFIGAHYDSRVGAADERASCLTWCARRPSSHCFLLNGASAYCTLNGSILPH